ncbi:MAG: DNA polymerase III subunit alpha [Alistipes sp.]|jgi:DNA polymerase-3 subunit alpha|nr:DNA polymerase III subunit alpha [Alistipes sp.]
MKVEIKRAKTGIPVLDSCVGKGLVQGGHYSAPDIDIDFQSDRRHEIKEYLEQRYNTGGRQRVFSAGTFSTMKLKAVLKDVARVHKLPHGLVNYITAIFEEDNMTWTGLFRLAARNARVRKFVNDYPDVIEDIRNLMGQPRSTSIHASAIIVTPSEKDGRPAECFDFLPLRKMDGLLVSEFDGYSVEEIGLLKEDVLATKELSKLGATIDIVNRTYGKSYTLESITQEELHDAKTYELLSGGFTQNVFQFSSRGITKFIMDVVPDCIEDLIVINALYRPATLDIGATEEFVRYKRGEVAPVYDYGTYEATKNTFGLLVYQEQYMSIAHTLGGFDLGKTDTLRKAIGKKNLELMATLKDDFIAGAITNGCPDYEATEIWHKTELAGGYSFNRSHAAAYALTAFAGAWLKANYPSAFYTVALQWADDKEIATLMGEMEQCSTAKIVPPDINASGVQFHTDYTTDKIFWSLNRIKMLGIKTAEYIAAERERDGAFAGIDDFIRRVFRGRWSKEETGRIPVTSLHVKNLILAGCFDKAEGVESVADRYAILERAAAVLGFELGETEFSAENIDKHHFWSRLQVAVSGIGSVDYRRVFDGSQVRERIKGRTSWMSLRDALIMENEGKKVAVCATVIEVEELSYKDRETGNRVAFAKLTLQQNTDTMELVCWNDFYAPRRKDILGLKDRIIVVTANIKYSDYTGTNALHTTKSSILSIE